MSAVEKQRQQQQQADQRKRRQRTMVVGSSLNRTGGSPEWPASCKVHPASYGCRFSSNQTGESPEWPACREVYLASYGLSVFPKNQTGESPAGSDLGAAAIAHAETRTKLEMHRIFTFMMRKQTRLIKIRVKLLTTSISERSTAKDARSRTAEPTLRRQLR